MRIVYQGEELPKGSFINIGRFQNSSELEKNGLEIMDVEIETVCDWCDGKGIDPEADNQRCSPCFGTGKIVHGDVVYVRRSVYDELVERARQRNLIRERYGDQSQNIADWWQR